MFCEMEMKEKISQVFIENGIDVEDRIAIENMDSLEYISILVALEELFEIEFPDSFLARNMFDDMDSFYQLFGWLLEGKEQGLE